METKINSFSSPKMLKNWLSEATGIRKLRLFPLQNENGLFGKTSTKYCIWGGE